MTILFKVLFQREFFDRSQNVGLIIEKVMGHAFGTDKSALFSGTLIFRYHHLTMPIVYDLIHSPMYNQ